MSSFAASMPNFGPARDARHIFVIRAAYMTGAYMAGIRTLHRFLKQRGKPRFSALSQPSPVAAAA
jgi:hypothetical protein